VSERCPGSCETTLEGAMVACTVHGAGMKGAGPFGEGGRSKHRRSEPSERRGAQRAPRLERPGGFRSRVIVVTFFRTDVRKHLAVGADCESPWLLDSRGSLRASLVRFAHSFQCLLRLPSPSDPAPFIPAHTQDGEARNTRFPFAHPHTPSFRALQVVHRSRCGGSGRPSSRGYS
jgi:hypothetical protein